jgi:hypothetical protein
VSWVSALDLLGNSLSVDPATLGMVRRLTVIGTHLPRLTVNVAPNPATVDQTLVIRGRLTDRATGRPLANRVLIVGYYERCEQGGERVVTDRNGSYRFTLSRDFVRFEYWPCIHLVAPVPTASEAWYFDPDGVAHIASVFGVPTLKYLVRATPARHAVALGGRIRIDGNVRPNAFDFRVFLQRWTVARGWVIESSAIIRESGRYTLYARPPTRGTFRYKVSKPGRLPYFVRGASPILLLTAS